MNDDDRMLTDLTCFQKQRVIVTEKMDGENCSIWNQYNQCLNWDATQEWFALLNVPSVPVLYDGIWDEKIIRALYNENVDQNIREGYVVRLADQFDYGNFRRSVAKFVRKDHVTTDRHWMQGRPVVANGLK